LATANANFTGGGTAEIAGGGDSLTIGGNGGSVLDAGAGSALTLLGKADTVTIGTYFGAWGQPVSGDNASLTLKATNGTVNVAGAHDALTLIGASDVVNVTGANATLTVTGTGDTVNLSRAGTGRDTVTASVGGDMFIGGTGTDTFNVVGHKSADTFTYNSGSASTLGAPDTITGFADTHDSYSFNDVLDFHNISGLTAIQGGLNNTNQKVNAHSIDWYYNAVQDQTILYANTGGSSVAQSNSSLMLVDLVGGNLHLSPQPNTNVIV
jgi:hypothetical protein